MNVIDLLGVLPYYLSRLLSLVNSATGVTYEISYIITYIIPTTMYFNLEQDGFILVSRRNDANRADFPHNANPANLQTGETHHRTSDVGIYFEEQL